MPSPGAQCWYCIEYRGVGVQDLQPDLGDDLVEPPIEVADNPELAKPRDPAHRPGWHRGPKKLPTADLFTRRSWDVVFAARQHDRRPAQRSLLVDNPESAIDIAALQRQRMVENVQDPHYLERIVTLTAGQYSRIV